ncbi:AAA family ATPase [Phaeobacter sp. NW0010-22]|uniref:AAA family ATPase n=1 Tax=Phaeobacter sp. NW0010-22 TaxID=3135907 RepID=UPI003105F640
MEADTTWIDGEVFALAGFDHDNADIVRVALNAVRDCDCWDTIKSMVLETAKVEDLREVLCNRVEEAAQYSDDPEDWREVEFDRLTEIDPLAAINGAKALDQMATRDIWLNVMALIAKAHAKATSQDVCTGSGKQPGAARYLVDKVNFEYLPRNLQRDMPAHIRELVEWSERFARLASLNDLDTLRAVSRRFPHCERLIEGIAEGIETSWGMGSDIIQIPPTLLVGSPGIGKTAVARQACKALDLHAQIANVGGKSENHLFGLSAGWHTAHPGIVTDAVATARVLNPVIILDEIDKTHSGRNGDITGELLGMLEPLEARRYREKYLAADVDASHVSWILTANDLENVPAPLRRRCTIYEIPVPTLDQLPEIITSLADEYASEHRLRREFFRLDVGDVEALTETYKVHNSVRFLNRLVRGLLHHKSRNLARN